MNKNIKIFVLIVSMCFLASELHLQEWRTLTKKERPTFAEIREAACDYYNLDGEQKKSGWKQYKRWEWLARTRLDRHGYFRPSLNWIRWLEKCERFESDRATDKAQWECAGPFVKSRRMNAGSINGLGRLNCIAFDPFNPNIMWVGAPSGGLWKSEDGGQTWTTNTDELPNIGVSDILIHPADPDIMYIALGDHDAGHSVSIGVLKSTDRGRSWQMTGLNPAIDETERICKLLMHPDNPDIILAATTDGIYKTLNGGETWVRKINGFFKDMAISPSNPSLWYATQWRVGIYRSFNSGETWTRLTEGLPDSGLSRINIAISQSNPQTLYASYAADGNDFESGFHFVGLYRSLDGGNTWSLRSSSPNVFGDTTYQPGRYNYSLGHYAQVLAVSPSDPETVYLGSVNLWKSTNGGRTWRFLTNWKGEAGAADVHVDHHELIFPPGSEVMFDCNDGGLFRSDDGGITWVDLSAGLTIRQIYKLGLSPHNPDHFMIGAHDNGSDYFNGEWRNVFTGDGMECFVDPQNPNRIYFSYQEARFYRSEDAGESVVQISSPDWHGDGAWVAPFQLDPIDPSTVYTATTIVLKSPNRGGQWSPISPALSLDNLSLLAVSPSNTLCMLTSDGNRLFRTTDGGAEWNEIFNPYFADIITDITYHPRNPQIVWLSQGGYGEWHGWRKGDYSFHARKIFRSTDGGQNWEDITGDLPDCPVNCIEVDPYTSGVYIGTDLGVFYSSSGRGGWQLFEKGLPNVIVTEMEIHPDSGEIWAGTFGRGIWRSKLAEKPVEPEVYPPLFFSGTIEEDKSLFQQRYFHILNWDSNPANAGKDIAGFRLYRVEDGHRVFIQEMDRNTLSFNYSTKSKDMVSYELTVVDRNRRESLPLSVTLNE